MKTEVGLIFLPVKLHFPKTHHIHQSARHRFSYIKSFQLFYPSDFFSSSSISRFHSSRHQILLTFFFYFSVLSFKKKVIISTFLDMFLDQLIALTNLTSTNSFNYPNTVAQKNFLWRNKLHLSKNSVSPSLNSSLLSKTSSLRSFPRIVAEPLGSKQDYISSAPTSAACYRFNQWRGRIRGLYTRASHI